MWSQQEIKSMMQATADMDAVSREDSRKGKLKNALAENAARQAGEEKQKQMEIDANKNKVASEANYNNALAVNTGAKTAQQKLETDTYTKLQPGAIEAGNAANKNDVFGNALSLARNKRTAMDERFVVNSAVNTVGLNDGEVNRHINNMDKENEAAIAASKRAGSAPAVAKPRKPYKAPFTGGIFAN